MDDLISRQAAIDALHMHLMYRMGTDSNKKRLDDWINSLPSAQPEKRTEERTETHACDLISRKWLMECVNEGWIKFDTEKDKNIYVHLVRDIAPSAQPDNQVHLCDSCKYTYPECPSGSKDVIFGNGIGNDNICACNKYKPSAQPEIIRCKDCKWYGRVDKRRFYRGMDCLQKHIDTIVPDRDFCSKAERRGEQDGRYHQPAGGD